MQPERSPSSTLFKCATDFRVTTTFLVSMRSILYWHDLKRVHDANVCGRVAPDNMDKYFPLLLLKTILVGSPWLS